MSKELTPLEAFGIVKNETKPTHEIKQYSRFLEAVHQVEKELKAQEQYVQIAEKEHEDYMVLCGEITRLKNKYKKQEKALEIIKEKQPDIYYVCKSNNYEDYLRIEGMFINMNRALTQEEYDLLKEELL